MAVDQERAYRHPTWHTSSCRNPKDRRLPDRVSSGRQLSISVAAFINYAPKVNIFPSEINEDLQTAGVVRTY
ncbi:hypothetical protein [Bradyrhizobium sp. CIR3A]|uniref:hypothetical protein n=1 Tax=Bradyrhizobium sp. CIR3A TaxID=2663838 RepID=UPI0016061CF6|nr:hypothetical protein [Bradyrhizobium sp. CIR3A]MBB4263621.1 hypothetical protein [Bradyrhizobium sp. CIR3A]